MILLLDASALLFSTQARCVETRAARPPRALPPSQRPSGYVGVAAVGAVAAATCTGGVGLRPPVQQPSPPLRVFGRARSLSRSVRPKVSGPFRDLFEISRWPELTRLGREMAL